MIAKFAVKNIEGLTDLPIGAIIGIEKTDHVFEKVSREGRTGEFVDFTDAAGKICRLYVRQVGKIPYGQIERKRW